MDLWIYGYIDIEFKLGYSNKKWDIRTRVDLGPGPIWTKAHQDPGPGPGNLGGRGEGSRLRILDLEPWMIPGSWRIPGPWIQDPGSWASDT